MTQKPQNYHDIPLIQTIIYTIRFYCFRYTVEGIDLNPVPTVDHCLEEITVGSFVAVHIENYDKVPVIGNVLEVKEDSVRMHYWKGSYKGKWKPQNAPRSQSPWEDELPKTCIILCFFSLTEGDKLLHSTRKHLQQEYDKLKMF